MTTQGTLWVGAAGAFGLTLVAGVADWRRARRPDLDDAGWMPWHAVQLFALLAALLLASAAFRSGS